MQVSLTKYNFQLVQLTFLYAPSISTQSTKWGPFFPHKDGINCLKMKFEENVKKMK